MPKPSTATVVDELKELLGPRGWLEGSDTADASTDHRGLWTQAPLLVARPATTDEVSAVVVMCREAGVHVVTQGGNTGLSGGSIPTDEHSVVISTKRMNQIIEIDTDCFTMTAEAGATIQQLQEAARDVDRQLAADWGARGTATLGGGLSTDAGGINVLRSGTMRDQVLGLEVVLPDGRVWNALRSLRKDASGYGLMHLFVGAEGTLGIITKAVVKLEPKALHEQSFLATVPSLDAVLPFYTLATEMSEGKLSAFELMPDRGIRSVVEMMSTAQHPLPQSDADAWHVLGRYSGRQPVTDELSALLSAAADAGLIVDAAMADSPTQDANLWAIRDELPPEPLFGVSGAKFDVAVPVSKIIEYLTEVSQIAKAIEPDSQIYAFGHVGDGNLHLYVLPGFERGMALTPERKAEVVAAIDELTWSHGGTISAEHGVGQDLRHRMAQQKGPIEVDLMRTVKAAFDPDNAFNPNKLFS